MKLPLNSVATYKYDRYVGPRYLFAELTIKIMNCNSGINFTCEDKTFESSEYFPGVLRGFNMAAIEYKIDLRNTRIHVVNAIAHEVDSCQAAFEKCAFECIKSIASVKSQERS